MGKSLKYIFNKSKLFLSLILISIIFLQSIGQSVVIKCPGMEQAMASATPIMYHGNMDHASMGHAMGEMVASNSEQSTGHNHYCPPTGCDICTADDCSQCSPFQLNAFENKADIWLKARIQEDTDQVRYLTASTVIPPWAQPPTRAPPLNI